MVSFPLKTHIFYPLHSATNLKMFPLRWIAEILLALNHQTRLLIRPTV